MSFVDEYVGMRRITLEKPKTDGKAKIPKTSDNQKTDVKRVSKVKIREVCMQDAISFNMINLYTNTIMKAGYKYVGDSTEYEKLFKKMMTRGDRSSIRRLKKELLSDRAKYGAGFVEIIPYEDEDGNEYGVADLRRINASKIDYVRDKKDNIILDESKVPYGFLMDFGSGAKGIPKGDEVPKELQKLGFSIKSGQVFINRNRVAVFPLIRLDNNYDYYGLIEAAYQDIVDRLEAMKIQVDAIKIKATSLPIIYVGDTTHEPTPDMMNDAENVIIGLREGSGIALPSTMKMDTVKFEAMDIIKETIRMLLSSSATAGGSPLALISGDGQDTNRSTLKEQIQSMVAMLQAQVEDFVEDWNIQIMDRIKEMNGIKGECELVWNGIRYEDEESETKLVLESLRYGQLNSKEYRRWLKSKNIIELDDDFENMFGVFINYPNKFHNIYKKGKQIDTTIDVKKVPDKNKNKDITTE